MKTVYSTILLLLFSYASNAQEMVPWMADSLGRTEETAIGLDTVVVTALMINLRRQAVCLFSKNEIKK